MCGQRHYGILVLILVVLAVFASLGLGRFGYSMVLPAMQRDLSLTNVQTGELQAWTSWGYLAMVAFAGMLASRYGPRRIIAAALAVGGLAMLGTGLLPTFRGVCAARFLTGVGSAATNVPAMGLLAAWFSGRRRGLAAGIAVTGSSLGLIVTGLLVPPVLATFGTVGWRLCWGLFGLIALAIAGLCAGLLRNRPAEVGCEPIGGPLVHSAVAGATGSAWRLVTATPCLWHLAVVYFAFGFAYIIYATFFVRHLQSALGLDAAAAGALWFQVGLLSIVSGFAWGTLSDRWGRRRALVGIFTMQGLAFAVLGMPAGRGTVYLSATLFALTAWSIPAVMAATVGDVFGPTLAPAALGLITIVFGVGQALGPYAGGWLADLTASFRATFLLAGATALTLGAGGALLLPRQRHLGSPAPPTGAGAAAARPGVYPRSER